MATLININNTKENWKHLDKYSKGAVYIIVIGLLIRIILASVNHVTGDSCWYINVVRFISDYNTFPTFQPISRIPFWAPPLLHIIGTLSYKIFSVLGNELAEFSIRLIAPICGTLMLAYTYLISRKLFNVKIAFYSVLFLTFIPDHIYHSSMFYPDILAGLLVTMGIYYILKDKTFLSGILIGLSFLTKYNALFAFPIPILIIIYNNYKHKIKTLKKIIIFSVTSFAIGSFWFIRNYTLLGNPVYPLFNSLFIKNAVSSWGGKIYLISLVNPSNYLKIYLTFFGVPNGYIQNLFFLNIPFLKLFIAVWFLGTFLFTAPAVIGLLKIKVKNKSTFVLIFWLIPYIIFSFLSLTSGLNGQFFPLARYLIPIFPIIAILWAIGFNKIYATKNKKIKALIILILTLLIIGFTFVEFTKAIVVKNSWNFYTSDFEWIKYNTPKDVKMLVPGGDCYSYNFNRATYTFGESDSQINSIKAIKDYNISYIWVNQEDTFYGKDSNNPAIYPEDFVKDIENSFSLVYKNNMTNTNIYEVR